VDEVRNERVLPAIRDETRSLQYALMIILYRAGGVWGARKRAAMRLDA